VPPLTEYINRILNVSDPLKFTYTASSYKPFISLFNVTGVAQMNDSLAGVGECLVSCPFCHQVWRWDTDQFSFPFFLPVNFAGSIAFEVRTSPTSGPFIRFNFKNGTDDPSYHTYGIMGSTSGDVPVQTFIDNLAPIAIETLPEWCATCGNNDSRGCQFLQGKTLQGNVGLGGEGLRWGGSVSPVGAGFLGAGLTVVAVAILVMTGIILGILRVGKKEPLGRKPSKTSSGGSDLVVCAYGLPILIRTIDPLWLNRITPERCESHEGR